MKLKGRKIIFGNPPKTDIVIFDIVNSQYVKKVINPKYKIALFNVRKEDLFVSFGIIFLFAKYTVLHLKDGYNEYSEMSIKTVFRKIRSIYFKSCIYKMNPKAVITMIDNNSNFHWLSKNCRSVPFIAIQNGLRLSYTASETRNYHLQHFFSFGEHEEKLYSKLGFKVEHFYPVGSLIGSLFLQENNVSIRYDMLIVSIWRGNIGFNKEVRDTMEAMKRMDIQLANYIRNKKIKAAIILRNEKDGPHWFMPQLNCNEKEYFTRIYGDSVEIIETDFKVRNIYQLMQQSKLSVSCLSSALLEIFGYGGKVLYFNLLGADQYHQDFDESIICTNDDYQTISNKLDELIEMPNEEYNKKFAYLQQHYMNYPKDRKTYLAISDTIEKIITDQPKSYEL